MDRQESLLGRPPLGEPVKAGVELLAQALDLGGVLAVGALLDALGEPVDARVDVVAVLVGGATMPRAEPTASTTDAQEAEEEQQAEPTLSAAELEAAAAAADAALAEAETAEAAVQADRIASAAGVLTPTSADAVVGTASPTSALAALAAAAAPDAPVAAPPAPGGTRLG